MTSLSRLMGWVGGVFRWAWGAAFCSTNASDNFLWIQRGLGLYLAGRYLIIFPNSAVILSDHGVNIPWMVQLPEPGVAMAMAMVATVVFLSFALQWAGCRAWVWWVTLCLHFYLVCVGLGSAGGAYEFIIIFSTTIMAIGATLGERSWAVRMLQIYVANIYLWAGLHKLTGGVWMEGALLRRVLSVGWGGAEINYLFLPFLSNTEICAMAERLVVAGEIVVPLLLVMPLRHKIIPIAATFGFHAGTAIFMNLAEFMCTPILTLGFLTQADRALLARVWRVFSWSEEIGRSRARAKNPALAGRGSVDPRDSGK